MKLKTGNPRVRGPRKSATHGRSDRTARRPGAEPSTFAWSEPLADVEPIVVEKRIVVERAVEKPVVVEKQVFVDRPVPVEKKIFVDRPVSVEKPVIVEKEVIVEKKIYVDRPVTAETKQPAESNSRKDAADGAATSKRPKAVIIGRGPSFAAKLARIAPKPSPVFAGVCALLIAIGGVALMSPSSDHADAAHAGAAFTRDAAGATTSAVSLPKDRTAGQHNTKSRDPFSAKSYKPPVKKAVANTSAAGKPVAKAPTAATPSLYAARFTSYSSITPWTNSTKRSGSWISFGGKPTVKVLSVGKASVELFVVTDVEVIPNKSKNFKYDNPLRQVHLGKGGVVRFADYRDIQGDDVSYTIRYGGSQAAKLSGKK